MNWFGRYVITEYYLPPSFWLFFSVVWYSLTPWVTRLGDWFAYYDAWYWGIPQSAALIVMMRNETAQGNMEWQYALFRAAQQTSRRPIS